MAKKKVPAKPGPKNKGGAPRKEIDFNVLQGMCQVWATAEEIASFFDISVDTLSARIKERYGIGFSDYYKKESSAGNISLRRAQFKSAMNGNVSMQIFLGKQKLGQRDNIDLNEGSDAQPVQVTIEVIDASKGAGK